MCHSWKRCSLILLLLQLLCYISKGSSIQCFVCDSSDNPGCADLSANGSIVPENCTLAKMKSLDTWLFDLNKFSYFDNGANKVPLMNCQKVVARDPDSRKLVTARFCQLDTGDSDACEILRTKLHISNDGQRQGQRQRERERRKGYGQEAAEPESEEDEFFCGICKEDRCNSAATAKLALSSFVGLLLLLLLRC
ncbi:CG14274 [Drosophila busckii]|uniref:CG14274 n=1 Tax=Drosophila busckii TaxID=30019 RepID=A0A0M5J608_DROBS|nr:uncharacterized protein LOC108602419 [Drosophila busckii]ALC38911.1 CG14274 [Drosophila busckii]